MVLILLLTIIVLLLVAIQFIFDAKNLIKSTNSKLDVLNGYVGIKCEHATNENIDELNTYIRDKYTNFER